MYAVLFVLMGLGLAGQAGRLASWWSFPLAWAATAVLLLSVAYATGRPSMLGKRCDGRLHPGITVVMLPYLLLTWVIWRIAIRLERQPAWHRVDDRLVVGRRMRPGELGVTVDLVVDLTAEFAEPAIYRGSDYRSLPMLDGTAGDPDQVAALVEAIAGHPGTVFIHCAQGHGRTGMVAALLLCRRQPGLAPSAALARLRAVRPGIGLNRQQRAAIGL